MNWKNVLRWKKSVVSTTICLVGCSLGSLSASYFLMDLSWILVLFGSLVAGLISCIVFMIVWEVFVYKANFKDALQHSFKMSVVPMFLMIVSENVTMLLMTPESSHNQMDLGSLPGIKMMLFAMSFGFLVSLPYAYFVSHKGSKSHH